MKKIFIAVALLATLVSCTNNESKNEDVENTTEVVSATEDLGIIEFENPVFEFGTVKEGAVVDHVFKFKNTGKAPVILAQVSASCGCTTPDYTKDPILPGKEGEIKVSFNSQGQVGLQQKIVTIASNAETPAMTVQLKGTVEK